MAHCFPGAPEPSCNLQMTPEKQGGGGEGLLAQSWWSLALCHPRPVGIRQGTIVAAGVSPRPRIQAVMGREGKPVPMEGDSRDARKPPWCPPSGKTWRFLNGRARDYRTVTSDIPTRASWVPPISTYKETVPRDVKPARVRGLGTGLCLRSSQQLSDSAVCLRFPFAGVHRRPHAKEGFRPPDARLRPKP